MTVPRTLAALVLALAAGSAGAGVITLDFDDETGPSAAPHTVVRGGLAVTISQGGSSAVGFADPAGRAPAAFGAASLESAGAGELLMTFSAPVHGVFLDYALDGGADQWIALTAFGAAGSGILDMVLLGLPAAAPYITGTLATAAPPGQHISAISFAATDSRALWDNLTVATVPLPATPALLVPGIVLLGVARRRGHG